MHCKIDGCTRPLMYKLDQVCQVHYFRKMRYGTYELSRKPAKEFIVNPDGYRLVRDQKHKLAGKNGYVFQHRKVAYDKYGENLPPCEICGASSSWETSHIDHIDNDVANNNPKNLRPLCPKCNTQRTIVPGINRPGAVAVKIGDRTLAAHEWAREPGVGVCGATIIRRIRLGASPEEAVYGEKLTHNGNIPIKKPAPPKHTRRNAIAITINGEKKTASEWSRHPDCKVSVEGIVYRIKHGWEHYEAVFSPSFSQRRQSA